MTVDPAIGLTARCGLALLLASSAVHKLRDLAGFRRVLEEYQLLPSWCSAPATMVLIGAEAMVSLTLVATPQSPSGLAALTLLATYTGALVINWHRGRRIACGCGGPAGSLQIDGYLIGRNLVLISAALAVTLPASGRALSWLDAITVVAALVSLTALYTAAETVAAIAQRSQLNEVR